MGYSIELKRLSLKVSKVLLLNYRLYVLWKNPTKENKKLFEKQRNRLPLKNSRALCEHKDRVLESFHVVSTWNPPSAFIGKDFLKQIYMGR